MKNDFVASFFSSSSSFSRDIRGLGVEVYTIDVLVYALV